MESIPRSQRILFGKNVDQCVHCGFCLPACPTYRVDNNELNSPRGRVSILLALQQGELNPGETATALESCLLCRACHTACPAGVKPGQLVQIARGRLPRRQRWAVSLFHWLVRGERRTWCAALGLRLYQRSGLRSLLRPLLRLWPAVARWESLIPSPSPRPRPPLVLPPTPPTLRVGLLCGCMARLFFPQVGRSATELLAALGVEVVSGHGFGCCGAPFREQGDRERFLHQARATLNAFAKLGHLDLIACDSAICATTAASYGKALQTEPTYAALAAEFAAKTKPLAAILERLQADERLLWRDPGLGRVGQLEHCQSYHGLAWRTGSLLARLPFAVVELPRADRCCGAGGEYMLHAPAMSQAIRADKLDAVAESHIQCLTGSNPGCLMHLEAGLRDNNAPVRVLHVADLLRQALVGPKPVLEQDSQQNR